MEPIVKTLAKAEKYKSDKYLNNPEFIAHHVQSLEQLKNTAERNKFIEELKKPEMRNDPNKLINHIQNVKPEVKGLSKEEDMMVMNKLNDAQSKLNNVINQQQSMNNPNNPFMNGGPIQVPYNTNTSFTRKFQAGGEMNPSQDRMQQLMQQAPGQQQAPQQPQQQGPDPQQLQQMFAQLPPEIQQQIQALPPEQQAQAIMEYAQQMQASQQPTVDPLAEGGEEQGAPMQQAPAMQQGGHIQIGKKMIFKCGGKIMQGTVKNVNHKTGYFEMD